jgi:hypothetical protein
MPSKRKPFIRASDIGSYVYCRRAWWLRRVGGFEPEDLEGRLQRGTLAQQAWSQSAPKPFAVTRRLDLPCVRRLALSGGNRSFVSVIFSYKS